MHVDQQQAVLRLRQNVDVEQLGDGETKRVIRSGGIVVRRVFRLPVGRRFGKGAVEFVILIQAGVGFERGAAFVERQRALARRTRGGGVGRGGAAAVA